MQRDQQSAASNRGRGNRGRGTRGHGRGGGSQSARDDHPQPAPSAPVQQRQNVPFSLDAAAQQQPNLTPPRPSHPVPEVALPSQRGIGRGVASRPVPAAGSHGESRDQQDVSQVTRGMAASSLGDRNVSSDGYSTPSDATLPTPAKPTESSNRNPVVQQKTEQPEQQPMMRPTKNGFGTRGTKIRVKTNHYGLTLSKKDQMLYAYSLQISASCGGRQMREPLPARMKRRIMDEFRRQNPQNVLGHGRGGEICFNKTDEVFSGFLLQLREGEETSLEFRATMGEEDPRQYDCTVTLKLQRQIPMQQLMDIFKTGAFNGVKPEDLIRPVDTILRQAALETQKTVEIGRGLFIPSERFDLHHGRIAISRLFLSARPSIAAFGLATVILTSGMALYDATDLLSFIRAINNQNDLGEIRSGKEFRLDPGLVKYLNEQEIRGLKVVVKTVDRQANVEYDKTYTISQLDQQGANKIKFRLQQEGGQPAQDITVSDYWSTHLGKPLKYPNLQCVRVDRGNQQTSTYLPIEYCSVKKNQQLLERVAAEVAEGMVRHYSKPAPERLGDIHLKRQMLTSARQPNAVLESVSLVLNDNPVVVDARVLPPPLLIQANRTIGIQEPGSWRADFEHVDKPMPLENWMIICIDCRPDQYLIGNLREAGQKLNISVTNPVGVTQVRSNNLRAELSKLSLNNLRFILFVKGERADVHDELKQICESGDKSLGVPNQVVREGTVRKKGAMANVLRGINAKLGGINHRFARPKFLEGKKVMVIGADVIHPTGAAQRKKPSIATAVMNMDQNFLDYGVEALAQLGQGGRQQEHIVGLEGMVENLMRRYGATAPDNVFYFRDGVSDGQFSKVLAFEVTGIIRAFVRLYKKEPSITCIVVTKRHQTRMAPEKATNPKTGGNVPSGTVADQGLCSNINFDWYLASQQGIQGTSRPAHYIVLMDQHGWTADQLQEFTYSLAFGYQGCTRAVSLPVPVYYADLACTRADELLKNQTFKDLASDNERIRNAELAKIQELIKVKVGGLYFL